MPAAAVMTGGSSVYGTIVDGMVLIEWNAETFEPRRCDIPVLPPPSSSPSSGVRLKPAAARVEATAVSYSMRRVLLLRLMKKKRKRTIEAAARPTMRNTPATAPLFRKNLE